MGNDSRAPFSMNLQSPQGKFASRSAVLDQMSRAGVKRLGLPMGNLWPGGKAWILPNVPPMYLGWTNAVLCCIQMEPHGNFMGVHCISLSSLGNMGL